MKILGRIFKIKGDDSIIIDTAYSDFMEKIGFYNPTNDEYIIPVQCDAIIGYYRADIYTEGDIELTYHYRITVFRYYDNRYECQVHRVTIVDNRVTATDIINLSYHKTIRNALEYGIYKIAMWCL